MLKGLKSKPKSKPEESQPPKSDKPDQITELETLIKQEQKLAPSDYNKNLIKNLKQHKDEDDAIPEPNQKEISLAPQSRRVPKLNSCEYCSESIPNSLMILESFQILLPKSGPLVPGHLLIMPTDHQISSIDLSHSELQSFLDVKEKICEFYEETYGKKAVFIEFIHNYKQAEHLVVEAFPLNEIQIENAYMTVVQEFSNSDDEWTDNKKLVFVKDDHINGKVPSGFSYVYFDFNMRKGLAHVIENQRRFKPEFARGLIAECLNVEVLFLRRKVSSVSMTLLQTEYQGRLKRFIERSRD